jgi:uncharacterized phage protein (TIGR02218 family)
MRAVPPALAAELQSGVTTLCRCWKTTRRDGVVLGFTDHDRDLAFSGVAFVAATGLDAAEAEAVLGLAVGGGDVSGALSASGISPSDIQRGLWDGASVETWLVDWRDPARRMLLDCGEIGEIRRTGDAFTAEVRGLAHQLDQERGRRYGARCDAELGDARCGVALATTARRVTLPIAAVTEASAFSIAAAGGFSAGAFTGGTAAFGGGAPMPVMSHARAGLMDMIALWAPPADVLAVGQSVTLTVGCDKRFETCRDRFANALNFRGFPHIPGNDHVMSYARQGEGGLDGAPVVA